MSQYIKCRIKSTLIPYMIIANQINIIDEISYSDAELVIEEFSNIDIDKTLEIIDMFHIDYCSINSTNIPMGGEDKEVLRMVPSYLSYSGIRAAQLGLKLTNDASKKYDAHRKFGQHYGDVSCLLGLAKKGKIDSSYSGYFESPLGAAFKNISSKEKQINVIRCLYLSIPIIQYLLYMGKKGKVNAFSMMSDDLSEESKERRGHSINAIFKTLDEIGNKELSYRISNIEYNEEKQK